MDKKRFFVLFLLEEPAFNDILLALVFIIFLLAAIISNHASCLTSDEYAAPTIVEHKSVIVSPALAAAFGKSECVVKPGIVLTSRA
jgi:hypothetical protein